VGGVIVKDVQKEKDRRNVAINKVGIRKVELPIKIRTKDNGAQASIATWSAFVQLKQEARGTHMSRFTEVLQRFGNESLNMKMIDEDIKKQIKTALGAEKAHVEVEFVYFIKKITPVINKECMLPVRCKFIVSDFHKPILEVKTPITTLCPCSKEISSAGAHNQRSYVTVQVISDEWFWIEDLVKITEESASCPIWPMLKRPDEKWVTEKAYKDPRFVEDVVREVAIRMREAAGVKWYKVICENEESIHVHNAYAEVEEKVTLKPWQKVMKDSKQRKLEE